jgi:hypothetical protein
MEMFEKVDALRERANVSYEEAKNALDRTGGDVLEAMILLEREGKTRNCASESFNSFGTCTDNTAGNKNDGKTFGDKLKALFHKSTVNYVVIDRKDERILRIPVLAMVLAFCIALPAAVIAIVVSLFLDCRYSFEGQDEMKAANDVCAKASDIAGQVKEKVVTEYNSL